ncbi:MAG TPA: hypothetical protein VHG93_00310 [Longimicrobium sp.]|nr:hypothetical protein [Longimicrobium sp.]
MNRIFSRRTTLLPMVGILMLSAGCGGGAGGDLQADTPPRTPTQYVVAVDLSTSLTPTERKAHQDLLHALVRDLDFGDRLVLLKTHAAGIRDTSTARVVTMPVPRGSRPLQRERDELELQRQTADGYVTTFFKAQPVHGTDLFATMHTAGERVREGTGARKVLVVLSDMLQCTRGVCMERPGGLPDSAWISAQKQQGLVPGLEGVCVSIVGADATTAHGVSVREFWRRYFQTAGASFDPARYVHGASTAAALRCAS